ncbi:MAG: Holliday junction branch migration protein RuvA [Pseudomonadota bacterium]
MIAHLRGTLLAKQVPIVVLEVGGVGYELEVPLSTFWDLPETGAPLALFTHLSVREDAHSLYGFFREADRTLFRSLLKISGIGAKMALAVLSGMTVDEFVECVRHGDTSRLTRLPGIGKKTAERLLIEMRDRVDARFPGLATQKTVGGVGGGGSRLSLAPTALEDAIEALAALGYKPADASRMAQAVATEGMSSQDILRAALRSVKF